MSDLDNMLSGAEPEPETQAQEAPEPSQEPEAQAAPDPEAAEKPDTKPEPEAEDTAKAQEMVPASVVAQLRQEIRALKQQPQQEQPKAPDVLDDPKGYAAFMEKQATSIAQNVRLDVSEQMTRQAHGDEVVDAAFQALQAANDPAAYQSVMQDRNPWGALVKWHQNQQVIRETGGDLNAWREQERAKIRQQIEAELATKQIKEAAGTPAPSLAKATGNGGASDPGWQGPADLDSLLS